MVLAKAKLNSTVNLVLTWPPVSTLSCYISHIVFVCFMSLLCVQGYKSFWHWYFFPIFSVWNSSTIYLLWGLHGWVWLSSYDLWVVNKSCTLGLPKLSLLWFGLHLQFSSCLRVFKICKIIETSSWLP